MDAIAKTLGLLSLWMLSACGGVLPPGSGRTVTEERTTGAFTAVRIGNGLKARLVLGRDRSVRVTGDDNLVAFVRTAVQAGRLEVTLPEYVTLNDRDTFLVEVTNPDADAVVAEGAADLTVSELSARSLDVLATGASIITATGAAQRVRMEASGASKLWLKDLAAGDVTAVGSGSSMLELCATGTLGLTLSGSSHARYWCHPGPVSTDLTGSSTARAE